MKKRILAALLAIALVISNVPMVAMATEADTTTPAQSLPQETISEETAPEESVPEESVPEESIPEETVPEESIPEESIPEESIPEESIPEESVPEESVPEESIPEETVPEESVPEESVPEESVPEESVPEESVPEESVPEESVPEESVPEESVPEESVPEESIPEESIPKGIRPGGAAPDYAEQLCTDGNIAPEADASAMAVQSVSLTLITEGQWEGYYAITTAQELNAIRNNLNGNYVLMNDIVFSSEEFESGGAFYNSGAGWMPIGNYSKAFTGILDGNGHTISNLYINRSSKNSLAVGLFGYCQGVVCNLGIVDCDITGKSSVNDGYVQTAALAGEAANATVYNCYATGTVTGSRTTGGLIGYVNPNCTITDCYNACTVTGQGYTRAYTGGLVGYINDNITVKNCYNEGIVKGIISNPSDENAFCATGGITSYIQNGKNYGPSQVINCYNTADIIFDTSAGSKGYSNYAVGGVVGYASGKLENCYNTGNLESDVRYLGGVTGRLYAEASGCYNTGKVESTCLYGYHYLGGIAGLSGYDSHIRNCYNTGEISSFTIGGGIVGYAYDAVSNCYNVGKVTAGNLVLNAYAYAGGIAGCSEGASIVKCWNYGDIAADNFADINNVYAYVGGLCGEGTTDTERGFVTSIFNSFNAGKVSAGGYGSYYDFVVLYSGGLIGTIDGSGKMENCYNVGKVSATGLVNDYTYYSEYEAGLAAIASKNTVFENCYYLNTNSKGVASGTDAGTKCSPTQMLMASTYNGFDFDDTWTMAGNSTYAYPELQSNPVKDHVSKISFASKPTKTEYLQFVEDVDVSGGVLTLTYNTGKTEEKAITKDMVSGFDPTYDGELSLKVTYEGLSLYYTVEIVPMKSISLTSEPVKKDYLQFREDLDLTGAALTVTYENGATRAAELTADMVSGYDNTVAGQQTITITLGWLTTNCQINIVPVTDIAVTTLPAKTSYLLDTHDLDVTGGEITVTYENLVTFTTELTTDMVSGFDNSIPGQQTLTVSYYGKTTTFDVFILCLDAIAVTTLPQKTTYLEAKETLDVTGGEITLYYNDGTTEKVDLTLDMVSGFDNTITGPQTLTVTYNGKTATFDINIQEKALVSIELIQLPKKLKFLIAKGVLDVTGGKLALVYDNGTRNTIDLTTDMVTGFDNSELGTITLTVSYGGFTTTYDVQICLSRTIALDYAQLHLFTGKTKTLKAKLTVHEPSLAPSKTTLVWTSSDKTVATVSSKGKITAKGVGETVITCYAKDDPDISASVELTVTKAVTSIKLDKTSATIAIGAGEELGKSCQINIKSISPSTATDKSVTWTSSNEAVATVDQNGLVTSVGEGKATIKATANDGSGKSASCKITVSFVKLSKVSLPSSYTLSIGTGEELGKTAELSLKLTPTNAHNQKLEWTSSKPGVATVDENGVITSVSEGTTTIKAKATDGSGKYDTCKVTVKVLKITSLKLPKSATLGIGTGEELGKTMELTPTINPVNPYASNLTWKSSKPEVATVDENGVITSVATGTTTITCKDTVSGKSATCKVTVKYVKLSTLKLPKSATLGIGTGEELGKTMTLTPTLNPANPYESNLTWKSSKPGVATVDENGVVTSVATGTTTITCKDTVSGKSATCKVTVKYLKITSLKLPKSATLGIGTGEALGKTMELTPTINPVNPYASNLTWKSSKPGVATVDENGVVTSVATGTTTITCKDTVSGKSATCKVTVKYLKITSLKLPKTATISIDAGEALGKTLELTPTINPANPYAANLTWKSSKPGVATVDENGVVTSVAAGTTTITCKDTVSGKYATCKVSVKVK